MKKMILFLICISHSFFLRAAQSEAEIKSVAEKTFEQLDKEGEAIGAEIVDQLHKHLFEDELHALGALSDEFEQTIAEKNWEQLDRKQLTFIKDHYLKTLPYFIKAKERIEFRDKNFHQNDLYNKLCGAIKHTHEIVLYVQGRLNKC